MAFSDFIVKNGLFVEDTEDAISSSIGGSFTTSGGGAIAKKLYVGSDVDIGGKLHIAAGTNTAAPITLTSGTNLTTAAAGSIEYDGTSIYFTPSSNNRKTLAFREDTHYIGTTSISLNRSSANLALTGINSVNLPGSTSGTILLQPTAIAGTTTITLPATTGTVVTTGDTGTVTSTMIANNTIVNADISSSAAIAVSKLAASTISGVTLGSTLYALSAGAGLEYSVGTAFDGSANATIGLNQAAVNTIIANTTFIVNNINIGTTNMSVTRDSGNQSFSGISSITFPGSTSGNITLQAKEIAGTTTITLPATTGTVVTTGDTGTVTSTMIAADSIINDDINSAAAISYSKLNLSSSIKNSDLEGSISDSKLLTISTSGKINNSATTATSSNTGSAIVSRDSNGDFVAGTITAALSGNASTADKLKTARNIQGVSFDGSGAITVVTAGTGVSVSGTEVSIGQAVATTSNVTFNNLTVNGNLNVTGTTYTNSATNTSYSDALIELHYSSGGTLTSNDGKDIGIRMHYFKTTDKNAALLLANDTQHLEFYVDGTENASGVFSGTYGVFKGSQFKSTASTGTAPFIVDSTTRVTNLNAATAGNADTVTNGVYTTDTGTVTSTMIANDTIVNADISSSAAIAVSKLAASTISGVTLGNNLTALTIGTGLSGASYNGSAAVTVALADNYGDTKNPYSSKTLKYFLAAPNGADGVPVFRTILASDIPTLNQNTTGSAATLTTARGIYGNNFDGSVSLSQIIISTYGGTGNGFTKFTGPTAAEKTFTLPDANATLLYSGGALGTPSGGTLTNCTFPTLNQNTTGSAATLTTSRNINGIAFNGSADITVTAAAGTLTGATLASGVTASSLTSVGTLGSLTVSGTINNLTIGRGTGSVSSNTVLGTNVLLSNTTGSNLTALGYQTLYSNTTGSDNVAIGPNVLSANTTGNNNVAVGSPSLQYNNIGSYNVGVGSWSLFNAVATVATLGIIVGGSGYTNGTYLAVQLTRSSGTAVSGGGSYPTANITVSGGVVTAVTLITYGSGFLDTTTVLTATASSIGGTGTGFTVAVSSLSTANYNTAIGGQSLRYNTSGSYNTAIGYNSGTSITSGSKNVIIGSYTGAAAPISATGSNYIVFSDGDGNVRKYIDNNGHTLPGTNNTYNLGSASLVWSNVYATTFNGALSGNAATATTAAACSGNAATATTAAACSGNAATATTATTATNSNNAAITSDSASTTAYVTFVTATSGNTAIRANTSMTYNASTNVLTTTASQARYADLAEKYIADDDYEPGTVLDFGGINEVTISNTDMSRKVAGIVSTNPGYLMNAELESEFVAILALTGRVPCKVQGAVRKGDMMVSASNGYARAEEDPKLGSVIGKALEDFNGITGVIEVVVGRL